MRKRSKGIERHRRVSADFTNMVIMIKFVSLLPAFVLFVSSTAQAAETALDRYIKAPDSSFKFLLVKTVKVDGMTAQLLDMTSQTWRTEQEVNRTEWKHWVTIIRPSEVKSSTALLFITGGANDGKQPTSLDPMLQKVAKETGSIVAELRMVPNQPLIFAGETKGRTEDSLIAYTWDKFLRGGDERWPARLPMTKSAVRAMDAITQFCATDEGGKIKVDKFVVSGGSKRGWTTWTTAAVDKRVVAIIPLVIDVLNIDKSMAHHYQAYGFWAPSVGDYTAMNLHDWAGTKKYKELMKIEEPFEYRDRLTIPKLIVNSAGDQFFLPDSSQFYFKDLKGEKYLRYVPNSDHSLRGSDSQVTLLSYYQAFLRGDARPKYSWTFEKDGSIKVKSQTKPKEVKVWAATNPDGRDFRLQKIGPAYKSTAVNDSGNGVYTGKVEKPAKGWTAYFVELTYDMPAGTPLKLTTAVRVIPDTLPSPAYQKKPIQ